MYGYLYLADTQIQFGATAVIEPETALPTPERYMFANAAEAEATYFVLAWFAISESAALGIFPLLDALNRAHDNDPAYFALFFEDGFRHFKDEQRHANLWCRALLDFSQNYPEAVSRMRLPQMMLKVMLRSIGKPHSVLNFGIDCLAFELVMRALYDVVAPRLSYPPLAPIFRVIIADEINHTRFDYTYVKNLTAGLSKFKKFLVAVRFWRNTLGVIWTVGPLLDLLDRYQPLPRREFYQRLAEYQKQVGVPGSNSLIPAMLAKLR